MRVEDLLVIGKSRIHSDTAKILLADLLNLNPLELLLHLDEEVTEDKKEKYLKELDAIESNRPLQYVLGYTNFYGNKFIVNENVLIPRFETEELVENTLELINEYLNENIDIIDLGCGSGSIGLTLKDKLPKSNVTLVDISEKALEVTKLNSENLKKEVEIIKSDMLENITKKYDVIISNPPYIKDDEEIEDIVKENEPHLALYGGKDGLDYYKKILENAPKNLKDKFIIAFEIGADQKEDITKLANIYLKDIKIICKKDMQGRDRMFFIISNNLINNENYTEKSV